MTADQRRALAAGLPAGMLLTLTRARRAWHAQNGPSGGDGQLGSSLGLTWPLPDGWWADAELADAVRHPAAPSFDEVFVAALRRRLR